MGIDDTGNPDNSEQHAEQKSERVQPTDAQSVDLPRSEFKQGDELPQQAQTDSKIDVAPQLAFEPYDRVATQPLVELKGVGVAPIGSPLEWKLHDSYGSGSPEAVQLGNRLGEWGAHAGLSAPGELGKRETMAAEVNRQGLSQADAVTVLGVAMDRMHPNGGAGPVLEADNGSLVIKAPGLSAAFVIDADGHVTQARYREDDPQNPLSRY